MKIISLRKSIFTKVLEYYQFLLVMISIKYTNRRKFNSRRFIRITLVARRDFLFKTKFWLSSQTHLKIWPPGPYILKVCVFKLVIHFSTLKIKNFIYCTNFCFFIFCSSKNIV